MVAGREPLRADWFTGGPVLSAHQQAEIYPDQYRLRLHDGLRAELPGAVRAWPELPWGELFAAYLLAHPARSFTLNHVATAFPAWWAEAGATAAQVELARLDQLVSRAFDAGEPTPFDPAGPLRLSPPVGLLRVTHNVHEVRHALMTERPVPAWEAAAAGVVIYRAGREVRHWVPPAPVFSLLEALASGAPLAEALTAPLARGDCDVDELQRGLTDWMAEVGARALLSAG